MDILLLLVERRGQLVSREEIIAKIWGKDVFLDTDSGINGAIRKIRQVLKDDREIPVFVQTVTGKGYRFIAAVTEVDTSGPQEDTVKKNEASNIIVQEGSASLAARTERRIFLKSWPGPPRWQLRQDGG